MTHLRFSSPLSLSHVSVPVNVALSSCSVLGKVKTEQLSSSNQAGFSDANPFLPAQEAQRMMGAYPDGDVARASLAQMNEISRRAEVAGMSFAAPAGTAAAGPGRPPSSASRIMAAAAGLVPGADTPARPMSRQDALARIEELSRARPTSAQGQAAHAQAQTQAQASSLPGADSTGFDTDAFFLPGTTGGAGGGGGGGSGGGADDAARYGVAVNNSSLSHEGLQVFTVGHLMPKSTLDDENGNWSFDASTLNAVVMPTPQGMGGDPEQEDEAGRQQPYPISDAGPSRFDDGGAGPGASGAGTPAQKLRVRRSTYVPGWAVPPRVLLVDDDAVSRRLSSKFLQVFGCTIDVAVDGVGAVNKMNLEKYDLVLMVCALLVRGRGRGRGHGRLTRCSCLQDIVMPKLDGVSATSLIRQFDHMTPIISMTSNSKPNEIIKYYSSGMNDILPKPFTKDGLLDMLEVRPHSA